jgi:hypothetical protein
MNLRKRLHDFWAVGCKRWISALTSVYNLYIKFKKREIQKKNLKITFIYSNSLKIITIIE